MHNSPKKHQDIEIGINVWPLGYTAPPHPSLHTCMSTGLVRWIK